MRSLAFKNLIWNTTWYKKNAGLPTGPAVTPRKAKHRLVQAEEKKPKPLRWGIFRWNSQP